MTRNWNLSFCACAAAGVLLGGALARAATADGEWREIARLPAPAHDLSGAELGGSFYVAGGCAVLEKPQRWQAYPEIWELTPNPWRWRVAAKLSRERIYCGVAAFAGKVWVVGGDGMEPDGSRRPLKTVEIYDPRTGTVTASPESPIARPMPLALVAGERLYVMGGTHAKSPLPGRMESIGPGETRWRPEPDSPVALPALAGAALEGRLYVNIPKPGFAIFDTQSGGWETLVPPRATRSCQMAAYRGEIWMMGGRDGRGGTQTSIFNPATRTWRKGPPLPRELSWGSAGVVQDQLIVAGGAGNGSYSDVTYVLQPVRLPAGDDSDKTNLRK